MKELLISQIAPIITTATNAEINSNTTTVDPNPKTNSNITVGPNTNSNSKYITASSNVQVDNPDNKKLVGTTVNAISAAVPS